jgi:hypothetical protein
MNELIPLTDEEFEECGLDECWRGFAYWDEEGYLVTISCHQGILEQLKPNNN